MKSNGICRTHIFKKYGSDVEKLALKKPTRIKRKTLEFNYTVKVEKMSLNGGGSLESLETTDLGDYIDFNFEEYFGDLIDDSTNYAKSSMDTMKMAGLSKF